MHKEKHAPFITCWLIGSLATMLAGYLENVECVIPDS